MSTTSTKIWPLQERAWFAPARLIAEYPTALSAFQSLGVHPDRAEMMAATAAAEGQVLGVGAVVTGPGPESASDTPTWRVDDCGSDHVAVAALSATAWGVFVCVGAQRTLDEAEAERTAAQCAALTGRFWAVIQRTEVVGFGPLGWA